MTPACPDLDEPVICYYEDLAFLTFDIRDAIVFFHDWHCLRVNGNSPWITLKFVLHCHHEPSQNGNT